jgi:catechol 2,3-dioxygenase-like lactoylglutathione lyase family enzyme
METDTLATDGQVDMKLEVEIIPVSDVDRAKRFYGALGWRVDADFTPPGEDFRVVQLTPPGSECSIIFGKGVTTAAPGSVQGLVLIVSDIEAARAELIRNGVGVSAAFHDAGGVFPRAEGKGRAPGPDPDGRSYRTYASFSDPDGNGWLLQEVKTRLPGRGGLVTDVATLTELLQEAEQRHSQFEPTAPKHQWSTFYAAYIAARERGTDGDAAAKEAGQHVLSAIH